MGEIFVRGTASIMSHGNLAVIPPGIPASCPSHKLCLHPPKSSPTLSVHLHILQKAEQNQLLGEKISSILFATQYSRVHHGFLEEASPPLPPVLHSGHKNHWVLDRVLNPESLYVWLLSPHSNQIEQRHLSSCSRRFQTLGQFDPNSQTTPRVYFRINSCSDLKTND